MSIFKETKSALQSKTIIGAVVALLGFGLGSLGFDFAAADQAALVGAITGAMQVIGALVAIWGRVVATKAIG